MKPLPVKPLPAEIEDLLSVLECQALVVKGGFITLEDGTTSNAAIVADSIHGLGDGVIKVRESIASLTVVAKGLAFKASV